VPKDNAVTTNFKQVKFSVQAKKYDVALRLFDAGPLRAEMRAHAATLPPGLEDGSAPRSRPATGRGRADAHDLFCRARRDLALEADRQPPVPTPPRTRAPPPDVKFLEAIWRYYNLVDFAVAIATQELGRRRLAFDERRATSSRRPAGLRRRPAGIPAAAPAIAQVLSTLIDSSSPTPGGILSA